MGDIQRTQITHDGETIDVEIEIMSAHEAGITDEERAKLSRIAREMREDQDTNG